MPFSYDFNKKIKFGGLPPRFKIHTARVLSSLMIALIAAIGTHLIVRAAPTILATMTDAFVGVHDGDGNADPGETIEYTAVIQNSGADAATGVTFQDIIDLNTTLVSGSLNVSPLAADDIYEAFGNTLLEVGVTPSGGPAVSVTNPAIDSLFDNDTEFLGDTFALLSVEADTTAPFTTTTEQNGSVTVEANGNFLYTPPVDFTGIDHFDYVITDDGAVGGGALTGTGRVTINVSQMVWYVKNDAVAGGLGRSTDPFDTLVEAQIASAANETIYVFHGDGATTGQNAGIILQSGQRLIGEGVALTVPVSVNGGANPTTLRSAGSQPLISNTGGFGVSAPDTSNVQIFGLNIAGSTNAVNVTTTAANSGSFELANNTIRSAGANGVDVNGGGSGTLTVNLHDNTITSTGNGIDIQRTAGNITITAFDDNVVIGNTTGAGINIVGTGSTILFDANPGTPAFDTVLGGTTVIGQLGNGVGTSGLVMNNIRGDLSFTDLDVYSDGGAALYINGTTPNFQASGTGTRVTANLNTPTLSAANGPALDVQQANVNIVLTSLSSTNSPTTGVSLLTVGGTFSAPSGSTITNATGTDFSINGNNNANANVGVTYNGIISDDLGILIQIQNVTAASTHSFTGAITDLNDGDGGGVSLTNNTGATITFSGGLLLSTATNAAFTATGGGTVSVCDENPCNPAVTGSVVNILTTTTGTALNVANTNIGANNLEFRSISANGAGKGIILNTTGSSGGLKVSGTGTTDGSGGTIQNISTRGGEFISTSNLSLKNMNFTNATTVDNPGSPTGLSLGVNTADNAAIHLQSVTTVLLDNLNINGSAEHGINGHNVNGFTLSNSTLTNLGNAADEDGIHFYNMVGTSAITNTAITSSGDDNINIQNNNNLLGDLPQTTTSNITISGGNANTGVLGSGYLMGIRGTMNTTVLVTGVTANNNFSGGIVIDTYDTATSDIEITGVTSTNNNDGISLSSNNGNTKFDIHDNASLAGNDFLRINILKAAFSTGGTLEGRIHNNPIVVTDGQTTDAIDVANRGQGSLKVLITNNSIIYRGTQNAISIAAGQDGQNSTTDVTVTGNSIDLQMDGVGNPLAGIIVNSAVASPSGDGAQTCADIGGTGALKNTFTHSITGNNVQGDIRVRHRFIGTIRLPGYGGGATDTAAVVSYLTGRNTLVNSPTATASTDGTASGFTNTPGSAPCAQPTLGFLQDNNRVLIQNPAETNSMALAPAASTDLDSANTLNFAFASWKLSEQTAENNSSNTVVNASTGSGGKPLFAIQPVPAFSGETVSVPAFTLPAGKSVTIKFQVTVNGPSLPLGTTQISNQATLSGSNFSNVLTDDPSAGGGSDPTITPVDRPDTTVTSINRTTSSSTNAASVSWIVTFADAISGLADSNFSLANSGLSGTPSITSVTAIGGAPATQWTVTASSGTGDGTLELRMANDTGLSHDVTNQPFTQPSSGAVYTIDRTPPTTTSFTRQTPSASLTNADTLVFRVTFSEAVTGLGSTDFTATGTTAPVTNIAPISTGVYDVTVSGGDLAGYNGAVGLNFSGSMSITDQAGNVLANTEPSTDETYTLDNTAPTILSFTRFDPAASPTNADQLTFNVLFSEQVAGIGSADFAVNGTTTAGIANVGIINTNGLYRVTISGGDLSNFNGTVGLNFSNTAVMTDLVGNAFVVVEPGTDETYTLDNSGPTVTVNQASGQADPTGASPINFTVTFSEPITGFATGDVTLGGSANPTTGTITEIAPNDGTTYNVAVSGMSGSGSVTASIALSVVQDTAGNSNAASTSTDNTVTFDTSAPTVTINQASGQVDPSNTSPINFTVIFSEAVTGFATGDVTLGGTANPTTGTVTEIAPNNGTTYNVAVSGMTDDGTVIASIGSGVAQDTAGNSNAASTSTDNTATFDGTGPTVTITQAIGQADPTSASPINFTVVFSEAVTGFATGDVTLSGTANATTAVITEIAPNNGATYNVAVSGMTGDGTVIASIDAGVATDTLGNGNAASTSTDNTVTFDTAGPTVTINQASGQADPTGASPINFTVVFSEPITGFATGDVTLGGTANPTTGTVTEIAPNDGTTYNVAVNGMTGDGTVITSLNTGVATDAAGNGNAASTSTDNTVTYDGTAPTVTINQAAGQADPTSASPVNFIVVFSEPVTGFAGGDITLSGTANAATAAAIEIAPNDGTTYNVAVSGMTNLGTVIVSVPASAANDAAGNGNAVSTSTDNTITYTDLVPPTIVSSVRADPNPTSASSLDFTVNFSEPVTGVDNSDFALTTTGVSGSSVTGFSGSGSVYTVTVNKGTGSSGTVRLDVLDNDSIRDAVNNPLGGAGSGNGGFTTGETYTISIVASVQVAIGGTNNSPFTVAPQASQLVNFAGVNTGAVNVASTNALPILPAERVVYNINNTSTSFSEMIGLPESLLDTTYWMPWYNNVDLDTQLRFANASVSTATVHVYIGGQEMTGSPFTLTPSGANQAMRVSFPNVNSGPVQIVSNVPIVAAERLIYKVNGMPTSFSEMIGIPESQLDTTYWMPWYNNVNLDTQLRIANVTNNPANITVTIGGVAQAPINLPAGQSTGVSFNGVNSGPMKIESNVNIVASQRVIYKVNNTPVSLSEMMGLPESQADTTYWMPLYNNVNLDSQLRIANISPSAASVRVFIGGTEVTSSPISVAAGASTQVSFAGSNNGPVQIVSNVPIVVTKRMIYKVNNVPTSFFELMGLPDGLLDTSYWVPWHNNVNLDTKIRVSVP